MNGRLAVSIILGFLLTIIILIGVGVASNSPLPGGDGKVHAAIERYIPKGATDVKVLDNHWATFRIKSGLSEKVILIHHEICTNDEIETMAVLER